MKELERSLGLTAVIAISVSTMLGSGIFVLPGLAAAKTGPSVWLAYLVAGLCVVPAAFSKAELGVAMPESGGTYVYLDRTFGPLVGTVAGIGLWLALLLKSAFALVGFTAYLVVLADVPIKPTAMLFLAVITAVNIRGIGKVSQFQLVVVGIALLGLTGLVITGAFHYDPTKLEHAFPNGAGGFFGAVGFVFVSYAGVTKVAAIAEEIRNPNRNLPLGIILSLALVMVAYGVVTFILVEVVPMDTLTTDMHPIYTLAVVLGGKTLGIVFAVIGVLTMTSMANAGLLAASRFPFAMSRDSLLPAGLHHLHSRYLTPTIAILVSAATMGAAILVFDVEKIAKLASAFVIMLFIAVNLAVLVLRETGVQWYKPTFRSPLYPGLQLFGIVSGLLLLTTLGIVAVSASIAIALPGVVLFLGYGRRRTERRGVVGQRGRRQELVRASTEMQAMGGESRRGSAVVALFGPERSPELLVELGASLVGGELLDVALVTELPEQTVLDAVVDHRKVKAMRRRVFAVADANNISLTFSELASRDIIHTASDLSGQPECRWLIMEWAGRSRGAITFRNPLGWLKDHLSCNLAILHDAGVRYIRTILVYVEPGPHDALVVRTAEQLAEVHNAQLTFIRFVPDDAPLTQAQSAADYLDQINKLVEVKSRVLLVRGRQEAAAVGDATIDYDLLVFGETSPTGFLDKLRGKGRDRLTASAACSVLRLQTPLGQTHASLARPHSEAEPMGPLRPSDLLIAKQVAVNLVASSKDALFNRLAESFAGSIEEMDAAAVGHALWERERTQNTAVGQGVALPHATLEETQASMLGLFIMESPVDYDAPDELPVDVLFVTMGPPGERTTHLTLLAEISKLVLTTDLLDRLRGAKDRDAAIAALRACEQQVADRERALIVGITP